MHSTFALHASCRNGSWIVQIEPHILSFLVNSSEKNCAIVPSPLKKKRTDLCWRTKPALNPQPSEERMKIMTSHSSETALDEAPHETETTTIITVSDATKRRAESVINDRTIDPQWGTIIRAALELNAPWLAELVTRAEA